MPSTDRPLSRGARLAFAARFFGAGAVVGGLAWLVAYESGVPAPWVVGVAGFVAVLVAGAGVAALAEYAPPEGAPIRQTPRAPSDREAGGLRRVERTIMNGLRDVDRFNLRVRPWLVALAEQRLHHRAGIDLADDPESARDLLGGTLWQLTQRPSTTAPTNHELADWIARLEAL